MAIHGYDMGNPVRKLCKDLGLKTRPAPSGSPLLCRPNAGPLSSELSGRIGQAFAKAFDTLRNQSSTSSSEVTTAASFLLNTSASFSSPEEKVLASTFSRAPEFAGGISLEATSAQWITWGEGVAYSSGRDGFVEGGYGALINAIAKDMPTVEIHLNKEVTSVSLEGESFVSVQTSDGQTFSARNVLSTIPTAVLQSYLSSKDGNFFSPKLPARKLSSLQRTSIGNLEKVCLVYEKAWWPSNTPAFHILVPLLKFQILAIALSSENVSEKSGLLVLIPHNVIGGFEPLEVHQLLAQSIPSKDAQVKPPKPERTFSSLWASDQFSRGATTSPCAVGGQTPLDLMELSRPVWGGKLGFAGEGTEAWHRGSVPGAIISGEREGNRIAALLDAQNID